MKKKKVFYIITSKFMLYRRRGSFDGLEANQYWAPMWKLLSTKNFYPVSSMYKIYWCIRFFSLLYVLQNIDIYKPFHFVNRWTDLRKKKEKNRRQELPKTVVDIQWRDETWVILL